MQLDNVIIEDKENLKVLTNQSKFHKIFDLSATSFKQPAQTIMSSPTFFLR